MLACGEEATNEWGGWPSGLFLGHIPPPPPPRGRRPRLHPFSRPLLVFHTGWNMLAWLCGLCPPGGRLSPGGAPLSRPPYLACAHLRSREAKDAELLSLCQITAELQSWNEATVSNWPNWEGKGLMASSDGVPAANQKTPPANGSLREKDNRGAGKFLPL